MKRHRCDASTTLVRRGFVLLTVLVLLTFAVFILARFSQQSIKLVSQAIRREREVQSRWATWSIANATLPRAPQYLRATESSDARRVSQSTSVSVRLGDQAYQIHFNDLDTAINLNAVAREAGAAGVRRAVNFGNGKLAARRLPKRLLSADRGQILDSWGQVFELQHLSQRSGGASVLGNLQQYITCWGSGQLSLQTASDENLKQFGTAIGRGGLYDRVVRERRKASGVNLRDLIEEVATSPADEQLLNRTLRQNSAAWSVLVTAETGSSALLCILESGFGNFADRRSTFSFE